MPLSSKHLALGLVLGFALSACHGNNSEHTPNAAVKVNGKPIGVAELNSGRGHGDQPIEVSAAMLKMTIDSELLRQAAIQEKLDTDTNVQAQIANANRMILATAYLQKQLATVAKPTDSEVGEYFKNNPARYAQRQQYQFQEFSIQPPAGKAADIRAQVGKVKGPDELEKWLTEGKISHGSTPTTTTGDQFPDDVLAKLKEVPIGGHIVLDNDNQMNVIFVLSKQPQPIALAQASAAITKQLWEQHKRETLSRQMKKLHDHAKIEYVAPYAETGYSAPSKPQ